MRSSADYICSELIYKHCLALGLTGKPRLVSRTLIRCSWIVVSAYRHRWCKYMIRNQSVANEVSIQGCGVSDQGSDPQNKIWTSGHTISWQSSVWPNRPWQLTNSKACFREKFHSRELLLLFIFSLSGWIKIRDPSELIQRYKKVRLPEKCICEISLQASHR